MSGQSSSSVFVTVMNERSQEAGSPRQDPAFAWTRRPPRGGRGRARRFSRRGAAGPCRGAARPRPRLPRARRGGTAGTWTAGRWAPGTASASWPRRASLLHVTAHPDDEHAGMLTLASRGWGVRTALLSLNRGEAGANAIGPELFDGLGLIRTRELVLSGRYYGLDDLYFTTAVDYGYSKSVDEAFRSWDREAVLEDMVGHPPQPPVRGRQSVPRFGAGRTRPPPRRGPADAGSGCGRSGPRPLSAPVHRGGAPAVEGPAHVRGRGASRRVVPCGSGRYRVQSVAGRHLAALGQPGARLAAFPDRGARAHGARALPLRAPRPEWMGATPARERLRPRSSPTWIRAWAGCPRSSAKRRPERARSSTSCNGRSPRLSRRSISARPSVRFPAWSEVSDFCAPRSRPQPRLPKPASSSG